MGVCIKLGIIPKSSGLANSRVSALSGQSHIIPILSFRETFFGKETYMAGLRVLQTEQVGWATKTL